jgi:hypothetical protein
VQRWAFTIKKKSSLAVDHLANWQTLLPEDGLSSLVVDPLANWQTLLPEDGLSSLVVAAPPVVDPLGAVVDLSWARARR